MDAKQIIAEVGKRHGILLDANDPVLVTVTLNQVVLEEYLRSANAASERQLANAKQVAGELVTRTAGYVADQVRAAAVEASSEIEQRVESAAASVRSDAKSAARHRNLAFVFMMTSALASAVTLSGIASCGMQHRDRAAALVSNAAHGLRSPEASP